MIKSRAAWKTLAGTACLTSYIGRVPTYTIYALYDPREPNRIRYIGCTCNLVQRLHDHRRPNRSRFAWPPRHQWMQSLDGLSLGVSLLAHTPDKRTALKFEYWLINAFRAVGQADLNHEGARPPAGCVQWE